MRWLLVVMTGLLCVFCTSMAHQRRPHTAVAIGGGAAQAYHRTFNCEGRLNHHEAQRQVGGGIEIDHESEGGFLLGGSASAQHVQVQEVSATNRPPQTAIAGEPSYWSTALAARVGYSFGWGSLDAGGTAFLDLKHFWPFLRVRGGALGNGLSGVVQIGTPDAQWGATFAAIGGRLKLDRVTFSAMAADLYRIVRSHQNVAGSFLPERTVIAALRNNGDPALLLNLEIVVDEGISLRLDGALTDAWGLTAWLVWTKLPEGSSGAGPSPASPPETAPFSTPVAPPAAPSVAPSAAPPSTPPLAEPLPATATPADAGDSNP